MNSNKLPNGVGSSSQIILSNIQIFADYVYVDKKCGIS